MDEAILERGAERSRSVLRNIQKLYLLKATFCSISFIVPLLVIFLMEQGLTLGQVLLLEGLFAISLALLDAPAGYFADTYGRKRSINVGSLMFLAGGICYLAGSTFMDFLIAELFFALGLALVGGADHALLYDSLAEEGKESEFQRICGNLFCLEMLSSAAGAVLGGLLALISLRTPFLFTVSGFVLMVLVSFTLVEPRRKVRQIAGSRRLHDFWEVLRSEVISKRAVLWLIAFWATLFASMQVGFWLYQPYMERCGIAVAHFGWIYAVLNLFGAYWARNAHKVESRIGFVKAIALAAALVVTSFLLLSSFIGMIAPVLFLAHQFVRGTFRVLLLDRLHRHAKAETRATVTSMATTASSGTYATALIVLSVLSASAEVEYLYWLIGLTALAASAVLLLIRPKDI